MDARTLALNPFSINVTVMQKHDLSAYGQSDTRSVDIDFIMQAFKYREDAIRIFIFESDSIVTN
jgi:hypothetical protein